MKQGMIARGDLGTLIAAFRRKYRVYGPVREAGGLAFAELGEGREPALEPGGPGKPVKELFFPQWEQILRYEDSGSGELEVSPAPVPEEPRLLFGLRPCDARALGLLDRVFGGGEFQDPGYLGRRRNTRILSLACSPPGDTCFCASVGGGPFEEAGSDVLAFADGGEEGALLLQACSAAGEELLDIVASHLGAPSREILRARKEAAARAPAGAARVDGERLFDRLEQPPGAAFWEGLARRCLGCATCTYLCPTCHCFAFSEERLQTGSGRHRSWDSCAFPLFTREVSGHNPRPGKGERMRQRIMHKFRYTVENFGSAFCVGCGRCVAGCPVNVDIREIAGEVAG